jgi:predicted CXXCH cytochrome family protein
MKNFGQALVAVALGLLLASSASAFTGSYSPGAGIKGTVHDLSAPNQAAHGMAYTSNPPDSLNRICVFCHAPHNAYKLSQANGGPAEGVGGNAPQATDPFTYLPLWNHTLQTNTTYSMYNNGPGAPQGGPKASQAILTGMTPGSTSLLCLSCHDGSVAVNSYGNSSQLSRSQSSGGSPITPSYQIGKDQYLGNHHPIGFDYDAVQQGDPEIRSADSAMLTPMTFVRDHLLGQGNHLMECGTCHSVHNKDNSGETLLWRSDQNSELCLTCHDKAPYVAP